MSQRRCQRVLWCLLTMKDIGDDRGERMVRALDRLGTVLERRPEAQQALQDLKEALGIVETFDASFAESITYAKEAKRVINVFGSLETAIQETKALIKQHDEMN